MGLIKKTVCPRCGREFSALKAECPYCGERLKKSSIRTPRSTDAVRKGSFANMRAQAGMKWQFVFGLCLVAAVIIAVIVLITTTLNGDYAMASPSPSAIESLTPSPSPSPSPTPTPTVESVMITFLGEQKTEFSMDNASTIQLGATIDPISLEGPVEWSSSDETIATVDDTGLVTAVGTGWVTIVARCYGAAAECKVLVK